MKIYEFFDEDYNKTVDLAEDIEELAAKLVKCLNKAEGREDNQGGEMNFRRPVHLVRFQDHRRDLLSLVGSVKVNGFVGGIISVRCFGFLYIILSERKVHGEGCTAVFPTLHLLEERVRRYKDFAAKQDVLLVIDSEYGA